MMLVQGRVPFEAAAQELAAETGTTFEYIVSTAGAAAQAGCFAGADVILVKWPSA